MVRETWYGFDLCRNLIKHKLILKLQLVIKLLSLIKIIVNTVPLFTELDSLMLLFIKEESLFKVFNNESKLSSATSIIMLVLIDCTLIKICIYVYLKSLMAMKKLVQDENLLNPKLEWVVYP